MADISAGLKIPKRKQHPNLTVSHRRAPMQEHEAAKRLGGHTVKGSGSGNEKGDVRVPGVMRLECKCTKNKSFSVTRGMVEKITDAAMAAGEFPAIEIEFITEAGKTEQKVAIVPVWVLEMLCKVARDNDDT